MDRRIHKTTQESARPYLLFGFIPNFSQKDKALPATQASVSKTALGEEAKKPSDKEAPSASFFSLPPPGSKESAIVAAASVFVPVF